MDANEYIRRKLRRKALRGRLAFLGGELLGWLTLLLSLIGLGFGFFLIEAIPGPVYFAYGVLSWLILLASLAVVVFRGVRRLDLERTAVDLESRYPDLRSDLISALQLGERRDYVIGTLGCSGGLIDALQNDIARRLPEIAGRPATDRQALARKGALFGAVLLGSMFAFLMPGNKYRSVLALLANPLRTEPFAGPGLQVSPGNARVLEGERLDVSVRTVGGLSGPPVLEVKAAGTAGILEKLSMERRSPAEYALSIPRVVQRLEYRAAHPKVASPWYVVEVTPVPRAGNLSLSLTPPAYTGMPALDQEGSGHVRCLKGTAVRWRAKANKPMAEASLLLSGGQSVPLAITGGDRLEGEFVVTTGGRYKVVLADTEGFSPPQPDEYDLALIPDEFPTAEILSPSGQMELDQAAVVEVTFSGRDDYGLSECSLVWRLENGKEGKERLPDPGGRRNFLAAYSWDLGSLALEPGQTVNYHVEFLDNDSFSGPKAGYSAGRSIHIKDSKAIHEDLSEAERELVKELTDLLGDELEVLDEMEKTRKMESEPEERFITQLRDLTSQQAAGSQKFDRTMDKMDNLLQRMSDDPMAEPSSLYMKVLSRQMFQAARQGEKAEASQLDELGRMEDMPRQDKLAEMDWMTKEKEKRVASMEQALNLFQQAAKEQKMEEVVRQQEDIVDRQRDLMEQLEKIAGKMDRKSAAEMGKMLKDIARMMEDLMEQLTSMQDELPEEFANADGVKDAPLDDMLKSLQEMAQALAGGDIEGAKKKAEDLLKKMGQVLDQLKEAARKFRDLRERSMADFREKRKSELDRLVSEQKELLQQTEKMSGELEKRLAEARRAEAQKFRDLLERTLGEVAPRVNEMLRDSGRGSLPPQVSPQTIQELAAKMNSLRSATDRGKLDEARQALDQLKEEAGRVAERLKEAEPRESAEARELSRKAREIKETVDQAEAEGRAGRPSQSQAVTPGEGGQLQEMAGRQEGLRQRAGSVAQRMSDLSKVLPMIPPEVASSLQEAQGFMESASGKLQARSPDEAVPSQREALYRLMQAQGAADRAASEMSQISGMQKQGAGASEEAGRLFGLMPSGSTPSARRKEGGRMGASLRNFRIPGSQEHEVPRLFREDVMESMKAGYPESFEKAIRQYFRSIAE